MNLREARYSFVAQTAVKSCCGIVILANCIPVPTWLVWSSSLIIAPKLHSSMVAGSAHKPPPKTKKKAHICWSARPPSGPQWEAKSSLGSPAVAPRHLDGGVVIATLLRYLVLDKVPQPGLQRSAALASGKATLLTSNTPWPSWLKSVSSSQNYQLEPTDTNLWCAVHL